MLLTCMSSKLIDIIIVKSQLASPAKLMALGRGPCRNSSAAHIIGMGPAIVKKIVQHIP